MTDRLPAPLPRRRGRRRGGPVALYVHEGYGGASLALAPDLAMLGYLAARIGGAYDLVHTVGPVLLGRRRDLAATALALP